MSTFSFSRDPGTAARQCSPTSGLKGSYSEIYPRITRDAAGMLRLFRQFSTPGGVPSHVGPQTPGSITRVASWLRVTHAFGAAFDNPNLVAVAVIGDGEAETGPLEGSWKGVRFLNPERDGAVLPVLHANGYKISGPTVLGRADDATVRSLLAGHGYEAMFVEGEEPMKVHRAARRGARQTSTESRRLVRSAAAAGRAEHMARHRLRTPKGWTGPKELDGVPLEGTFRSHQVPLAAVRTEPRQLAILEAWIQSYEPPCALRRGGRLSAASLRSLPRAGAAWGPTRMPTAVAQRAPHVPDFTRYALDVPAPGAVTQESTRALGALLRDVYAPTRRRFASSARTRPIRTALAPYSTSRRGASRRRRCPPTTTSRPRVASWKS